ncbi:MAG: preprotein translocase subunit YajC [Clostridiales bacterium]|nr:preprotein translocase subunit YajC [Clostridiales bacterium]
MINLILTSAPAASSAAGGNALFQGIPSIIMLVAIVAIFYFFMYRPQKKQEKEFAAMIDALTVGDEITTKGGIIGKIISIKEETVMIETGNERTKIRILRSAVSKVDVKAEDSRDA